LMPNGLRCSKRASEFSSYDIPTTPTCGMVSNPTGHISRPKAARAVGSLHHLFLNNEPMRYLIFLTITASILFAAACYEPPAKTTSNMSGTPDRFDPGDSATPSPSASVNTESDN